MGCLLILLATFAPRLVLVLMWIFGDMVDRAFSGFVVPLLGLVVLPYTTLFYVLAWSPVGGVSGWGWAFVVERSPARRRSLGQQRLRRKAAPVKQGCRGTPFTGVPRHRHVRLVRVSGSTG